MSLSAKLNINGFDLIQKTRLGATLNDSTFSLIIIIKKQQDPLFEFDDSVKTERDASALKCGYKATSLNLCVIGFRTKHYRNM